MKVSGQCQTDPSHAAGELLDSAGWLLVGLDFCDLVFMKTKNKHTVIVIIIRKPKLRRTQLIGSGCSSILPPSFLTITSLKPHFYFRFLTLKEKNLTSYIVFNSSFLVLEI